MCCIGGRAHHWCFLRVCCRPLPLHVQLLRSGQVWDRAPVPAVSEPMLKAAETREGAQVTLTDPTVCTVAFSRGQERQVFFAVQGLPQVGEAVSAHPPAWRLLCSKRGVQHFA